MNRILLLFAASLAISTHAGASNPVAGKEKAKPCAACHGETGATPIQDNPKLAGQHYSYLVAALNDYKSGKRRNPVMAGMVANLSRQDIADLAAYFSSQPSVLQSRH